MERSLRPPNVAADISSGGFSVVLGSSAGSEVTARNNSGSIITISLVDDWSPQTATGLLDHATVHFWQWLPKPACHRQNLFLGNGRLRQVGTPTSHLRALDQRDETRPSQGAQQIRASKQPCLHPRGRHR